MTVFVSPFHGRILRVALLTPDRAIPEWHAIRDRMNLDTLHDPDAIRLLPLVYRTLADSGTEDPYLARLKGVVRRAWYDNQRLFHGVGSALEALEDAGVRAMLLKGVPLAIQCYPEVGLRPMVDVDVLVEPRRAREAISALERAGWPSQPDLPDPEAVPYGEQMLHQVACVSAEGHAIDLHWRYVPWVARDGSGQDPALWACARDLEVAGRHALAPGPDDLLLLVILHAYRAGWATAPRWVADTTFLLRAMADELDWNRFTSRVVEGHLVDPVRDGLQFVHREYEAPVPAEVLRALAATRVGRWEHHRHAVASREVTGERRAVVGELDDARIGWARWSLNLTFPAIVRSLPLFVTRRLGLERASEIPAAVTKRGLRNLTSAVRRTRASSGEPEAPG
jgi:hypothetical protein